MKNKFISTILILVMMITATSLMPVGVFADSTTEVSGETDPSDVKTAYLTFDVHAPHGSIVVVEPYDYGDGIVDTLVYRNDTIVVLNNGRVSDWKVDYVLPKSQTEAESRQFFPPIVMNDIVKAYMWVQAGSNGDVSNDFKVPIELGYKDINGKWYKKTFELSISCSRYDDRKNAVICQIRSGLSDEEYIRELEEEIRSN